MKALRFFFAVFLSMLLVFLLATGEVKRWLSREKDLPAVIDIAQHEGSPPAGKNLLEFPFYDIETGRLRFNIQAEFSQEELPFETKIKDISKLTLRNGVIEVPIYDDEDENTTSAKGASTERVKNLLLEFKTSLYQRGESTGAGEEKKKGQFEVLLKDGRGTTNDGTEFFFEDLAFTNQSKSGDKNESAFFLRSGKPVSIQNPSFALSSPGGFQGTLKGRGLEDFTFLPPVSALIDPGQPSVLNLDADRTGPPLTKGAGSEPAAPEDGAPSRGSKIAVRCQGPLSLVFEGRKRDVNPPRPAQAFIRFQKDVVVYSADPASSIGSLPEPQGNRFECQRLDLEFESGGTQFYPRRAIAVSEGGRVKAILQREAGGPYTIDGEKLEWTVGKPGGDAPTSEGILHGDPTLRGEGMAFHGKRALFHLNENRITLESVEGSLDYVLAAEKEGHKSKKQAERVMTPTGLEGWGEDEAGLADGSLPKPRAKAEGPSRPNLPQLWDLKADEAEFFFQSLDGRAQRSPQRDFSRFVARSKEPGGVVLKSRQDAGTGEAAKVKSCFQVNSSLMTYVQAEKKAVLEGVKESNPKFSQGESWIEARRIHLLLAERVVWFDEEVRAHVTSIEDLRAAAGGKKTGEEKAAPGKSAREPADDGLDFAAAGFDADASFLAVRFQGDKRMRDLLARGSAQSPVRVTSLSSRPWTFKGPEFYWDGEREFAQLAGLPRDDRAASLVSLKDKTGAQDPAAEKRPDVPAVTSAGSGVPRYGDDVGAMARLEFEDGELVAQRIRFHRSAWKAFLSDNVVLRTFERTPEKGTVFEVRTGKADVQFHPEFKKEGPEREGTFRFLGQIQSFHAQRSPERPIEIKGRTGRSTSGTFTARAEESTWDGTARQLRFFGNGEQEIDLFREDFKGPIYAREIVYDESRLIVTLRGSVHGSLVQAPLARGTVNGAPAARIEPASHSSGEGAKPMVWQFDTSVLEIQLRQDNGKKTLSLVSARARDKVFIRNEELGIQLRGDDLIYEDATRKVRVFSPDDRPQTLLCDKFGALRALGQGAAPAVASEKAESAADKVHKIVAQEICLLLYENPHAISQRAEPREWLMVEFERDVIGSFYLPSRRGKEVDELGDTWKMVAEKLTLFVDPTKPFDPKEDASARRLVPWAIARGNVVFSSGAFQATADSAIYEDPKSSLTLIGSPARLSQDNKPKLAEPQIVIRKVGGKIGLEYGKLEKPVEFPSLGESR